MGICKFPVFLDYTFWFWKFCENVFRFEFAGFSGVLPKGLMIPIPDWIYTWTIFPVIGRILTKTRLHNFFKDFSHIHKIICYMKDFLKCLIYRIFRNFSFYTIFANITRFRNKYLDFCKFANFSSEYWSIAQEFSKYIKSYIYVSQWEKLILSVSRIKVSSLQSNYLKINIKMHILTFSYFITLVRSAVCSQIKCRK